MTGCYFDLVGTKPTRFRQRKCYQFLELFRPGQLVACHFIHSIRPDCLISHVRLRRHRNNGRTAE
jgi:hypothetical protein